MGLSMKRHIVFLLITLAAAQAFAAGYPSRPMRIVTPFQPGGGLDVVAARYSENRESKPISVLVAQM